MEFGIFGEYDDRTLLSLLLCLIYGYTEFYSLPHVSRCCSLAHELLGSGRFSADRLAAVIVSASAHYAIHRLERFRRLH